MGRDVGGGSRVVRDRCSNFLRAPASFPAWPFSLLCFPDAYIPNFISWTVVPSQFGTFPMFAIPPALPPTKVLFQSVGIGGSGFELSTPAVVDIN
jgi:hypothetical protein